MKKLLPVLMVLVLGFGLLLTGCGGGIATPPTDAHVYGNGGTSVTKGEYVYFINGYEGYSTIGTSEHKNVEGQVELSEIQRAKVVDGEFTDVQTVASKVAGFESTGLYIFGEKLFFLSPNTHKDETGSQRVDLVSLFSVNLDGTGLKELYTSDNWSTGKFSMKQICNKLFAFLFDGTKIVKIEISGKKANSSVIVESSTGALFPKDATAYLENEDSSYANLDFSSYIYYTRARTDSEGSAVGITGNVLEKINMCNGEITKLSSNNSETISLSYIDGDRVYYTKNSCYYSNDFSTSSSEVRHTYTEYTTFYPLGKDGNGNHRGFAVVLNSRIMWQAYNSINPTTVLVNESASIMTFNNGYLYYLISNDIYRTTLDGTTKELVATEVGTINSNLVADFDGRFVYYLSQPAGAESNVYLLASDTYAVISSETKSFVCGHLLDVDNWEADETEE